MSTFKNKSKSELVEEIESLKKQVQDFERIEEERKKAEEALRESEERYRLVVDNTDTGFVVVDDKGMVINANEPYLRLVGAEQLDDIIGRSVIEWTAPESREENAAAVALCAKQGYVKDFETNYLRNDGTRVMILINAIMHETSDGKQLSAQCRDITKRRRAEKALKESEEKFSQLAQQSPNMIFINQKGKVVYVNKKCEEVTGYSKSEFYSSEFDFKVLIQPEYLESLMENFKKHMEGKDVLPFEYAIRTKNGERVEVIINTKLIKYGEDWAILGIITDITERKQAEEELKKRNIELETFNEVTVGRELKVIELKKEINEMLEKSGEKPKYEIPV